MSRVKRLLMLYTVLSVAVFAAAIACWIASARKDFVIPIGSKWYIEAAAEGDRFNSDQGGWWFWFPHKNFLGERSFFPDGWNSILTLNRRNKMDDPWYPAGWGDVTLATVRIHRVIYISALWIIPWVLLYSCRTRFRPGFPVVTSGDVPSAASMSDNAKTPAV
jgi:hypothetical protein